MELALEKEATNALCESNVKGMVCTGQHGLLLASAGRVETRGAGFLSAVMANAIKVHPDQTPIVTVETRSK